MTKEDLLRTLWRLKAMSDADPEAAHGDADNALLEFINDAEITAAFNAVHKWYA